MGEQFEVVVIKAGGHGARDQAKGSGIGNFGTKDRAGRDPELEDFASSDIAAKQWTKIGAPSWKYQISSCKRRWRWEGELPSNKK